MAPGSQVAYLKSSEQNTSETGKTFPFCHNISLPVSQLGNIIFRKEL